METENLRADVEKFEASSEKSLTMDALPSKLTMEIGHYADLEKRIGP